MTYFFKPKKSVAIICSALTQLVNRGLQAAKNAWPKGKMLARFANPFYGIRDLTIAILISTATSLVFQFWAEANTEFGSLDMLGWLLESAVFAAVYLTIGRSWDKAGLSMRIKGQGLWFVFAFGLAVSIPGILLLFNQITGYVPLEPEAMRQGAVVGIYLIATMVLKNALEEFVFRGFLTGRFAEMGYGRLKGHLLTGLIWAAWHLTYWFTLLPAEKIADISGLPVPTFVILGFVILPLQSVLLGELRLITGSIWVGVVLQAMKSIFLVGLVAAHAVPRGDLMAMILTPADFGLFYSGVSALIGLALWRWRVVLATPARSEV